MKLYKWIKSLYWRWRVRRITAGPINEIIAVHVDGKQVYP